MSILRESSLFCLLALSTLGVAACGDDPSPPVDAHEPVDPEPCLLRFDTEPLRWAAVGVGYEAAQQLQLSNDGEEACTVALTVEGDGFTVEAASVVVEADAPQMIAVIWSPTAAGAAAGTLSVAAGELDEAIALEGEAVASCLSLSPEVVDFGEAAPGCSTAEADVLIENGCSHPVAIHSIRMEAEMNAPGSVFGFRSLPMLAVPIAPGDSTPFRLAYKPQEVGVDQETVTVVEENGASATAALRGTGRLGVRHSDIFSQGRQASRTDLLFVVDDSPAMAPYLANLQNFAEALATASRDHDGISHFGVTTTSRVSTDGCVGSGADGRLVPYDGSGPRWLSTADTDVPTSAFADLLDIDTCSQAPNEGLAAAVRALTDPLVSEADDPLHPEPDDGNLGFRRDVSLSLFFVSASDDVSTESLDDIEAALAAAAGGPEGNSELYITAIVAPTGGCDAATAGARYAELAARTAGGIANICEPVSSWEHDLLFTGHGGPLHTFSPTFFLTSRPQDADGNGDLAGEITVEVDGEEVAAVGGDDEVRWTYDAVANAIVFEPDHVPPEGSQVAIIYFLNCE